MGQTAAPFRRGHLDSVLLVTHLDAKGRFVLGAGRDADFLMDADLIGATRFTLVQNGRLVLPARATGALWIDGVEQDLTDLRLDQGVEARIELGAFRIMVRRVHAGENVASQRNALDWPPLFFIGGTMAVAGLLLAMMSLVPPHGMTLNFDSSERNSRLVSFVIDANTLQIELEPEAREESETGEQGHADWGNIGKRGDSSAAQTTRVSGARGDAIAEEPRPAHDRTQDFEQNSTVLDAFRSAFGTLGEPTSPYNAARPIRSESANAIGALIGTWVGENHGYGGLSLGGTGRHAGGDGGDMVGLGGGGIGHGTLCSSGGPCDLGHIGRGSGAGAGIGHATRNETVLPERTARTPRVRFCHCGGFNVQGALSAAVIRREVRRHHNEMKFCYAQALITRPGLEGDVTTRFSISPNGSVITARIQSSTLHHRASEMCLLRVVQRFLFPAPENAGVVNVTYPFTFASH